MPEAGADDFTFYIDVKGSVKDGGKVRVSGRVQEGETEAVPVQGAAKSEKRPTQRRRATTKKAQAAEARAISDAMKRAARRSDTGAERARAVRWAMGGTVGDPMRAARRQKALVDVIASMQREPTAKEFGALVRGWSDRAASMAMSNVGETPWGRVLSRPTVSQTGLHQRLRRNEQRRVASQRQRLQAHIRALESELAEATAREAAEKRAASTARRLATRRRNAMRRGAEAEIAGFRGRYGMTEATAMERHVRMHGDQDVKALMESFGEQGVGRVPRMETARESLQYSPALKSALAQARRGPRAARAGIRTIGGRWQKAYDARQAAANARVRAGMLALHAQGAANAKAARAAAKKQAAFERAMSANESRRIRAQAQAARAAAKAVIGRGQAIRRGAGMAQQLAGSPGGGLAGIGMGALSRLGPHGAAAAAALAGAALAPEIARKIIQLLGPKGGPLNHDWRLSQEDQYDQEFSRLTQLQRLTGDNPVIRFDNFGYVAVSDPDFMGNSLVAAAETRTARIGIREAAYGYVYGP